MKKAVYNNKGNQVVKTQWKEFDKQTNCIATGNVYANTQVSSFIRPWLETKCNEHDFKAGHLMKFDLDNFRGYRIPEEIESYIRDKYRKDSIILYMFFTVRDKCVTPFGWVLTDKNYKLLKWTVVRENNESFEKRWSALNEAIQYITK